MEQKQKENEDDNDEEEKEQVFSEFRSWFTSKVF